MAEMSEDLSGSLWETVFEAVFEAAGDGQVWDFYESINLSLCRIFVEQLCLSRHVNYVFIISCHYLWAGSIYLLEFYWTWNLHKHEHEHVPKPEREAENELELESDTEPETRKNIDEL